MTAAMLPDAVDREQAVLTHNHAFVWASAGTGKTHTLTLRALYLLLTFGYPGIYSGSRHDRLRQARKVIDSLVLTTFTRKAAAEMQTRLYGLLDLIVSCDSIDEFQSHPAVLKNPLLLTVVEAIAARPGTRSFDRIRSGAQALAENAADFQISTIHSFAATLLKRNPIESRLSPSLKVGVESEDLPKKLPELVVDRWWQTEAIHNKALSEQLNQVMQFVSTSQVRAWLVNIFSYPWIVSEMDRLNQSETDLLRRVKGAVQEFSGALPLTGGSKIKKTVPRFRALAAEAAESDRWVGLAEFLKEHDDYFFAASGLNKGFQEVYDAGDRSEDARYFFAAKENLLPLLNQACLVFDLAREWDAWRAVARSFSDWAKTATGREFNMLTFDEIITRAVELLANPEVQAKEYRRLKAVLVDEFQDTDPVQLELLERLLKKPAGMNEEVIGFFVGDEKQSIYRFRGADIPSILHFFANYSERTNAEKPKEEYNLCTSFRSLKTVTDFANDLFENGLALPKAPLSPFRNEDGRKPRWILPLTAEGAPVGKAGEKRALTAQCAVAQVLAYMGEVEGARFRDILLLVRNNNEVAPILAALQQAGVPVISTGVAAFEGYIEVQDILNLLIAVHNPLDTVAITAVLRSPMVFLSNDEIHRLYAEVPPSRVFQSDVPLPAWVPVAASARIARLREIQDNRLKQNLTDWLHSISEFVPKFAYVDYGEPEGRAYARLQKVLGDFRRNCITANTAPLEWLLTRRDLASRQGEWNASLGEDVATADESVEAVRVMTVHSAKGLQGKYVILCGWDPILATAAGNRSSSGTSDKVIVAGTEHGTPLQGFSLGWGPLRLNSARFAEAETAANALDQEEAKRIAYVAVTRAEDRLTLIQAEEPPEGLSDYLRTLILEGRETGESRFSTFEAWREHDLSGAGPTPPEDLIDRDRYRDLWEQPSGTQPPEEPRPYYRPADDSDPEPSLERYYRGDGEAPPPSSSLATGAIVHLYLERHLHEEDYVPEKLKAIKNDLGSQAGSQADQAMAETILRAFYVGDLKDDLGIPYAKRIRRSNVLGREVPFFSHSDGKPWHGVVDLVLDTGDRIIAVDYKTSSPLDPLPESYQLQRRVYTEVLRRVFPGRRVSFEFWWMGKREEPTQPRQQALPFM